MVVAVRYKELTLFCFTNKEKTMIRLNVFIRTTESNREELVNTARELVAASLKDEAAWHTTSSRVRRAAMS